MIVKYRCNGCPIDGNVDVPPRGDMGILEWMETVKRAVSRHHSSVAGRNHGTFDIAIPIEAHRPIGDISDEVLAKAKETPFPDKTE
jgi:hypothetical protein